MAPLPIATDRLILDPLADADAEALFTYRSHPDISRYQGWEPTTVHDAAQFIASFGPVPFDVPGTWSQLAIRTRDPRRLVGDVGVHFLSDGRQVELGFSLAPEHQGRGFATEAVAAVIDAVFGALGKHRVTASLDPRNDASLRLVRRLGMREEAHFSQSLWSKGEWADDLVFALLASEWRR